MPDSNDKFRAAREFLRQQGDDYIKNHPGDFTVFKELRLPAATTEAEQCSRIRKILCDYSKRDDAKRPLSIAMFGPPGSGKSFAAEQLTAHAEGYEKKPQTINLSQLDNPSQLAESLLRKLGSRGTKTPVILFDEFDADLNGQDLGWLKWFLAPMQDAVFFHQGQACPIPQAVFFFAGGTAERFEDFQARHFDYFVQRKGPDFVSRLRGTLDIEGVNTYDDYRIIRRALVLQNLLRKREKKLVSEDGTANVDEAVLRKLLDGGYYKHGARSMEALLDICELTDKVRLKNGDLPDDKLLQLHVSRGPLDGRTIGFSAGLSVNANHNNLVDKLAETLVKQGATLAYCGNLGATLGSILGAAEGLSEPLYKKQPDYRMWHLVPYPVHLNRDYDAAWKEKTVVDHMLLDELQTLSADETKELTDPTVYFIPVPDKRHPKYRVEQHVAWSLSLFRMRVRLIQGIEALVVVGGKGGHEPELEFNSRGKLEPVKMDTVNAPPWGRFPGVAEEVMLALAFKKPVYVVGMLQGAAKDVGILLGLSRKQLYASSCLPVSDKIDYELLQKRLDAQESSFQVPHLDELPTNFQNLRQFFCDRALGSNGWPRNALSPHENRDLFDANSETDIDKCIQLILRGIKHLEWAEEDRSRDEPAYCRECGQPTKTPAANS